MRYWYRFTYNGGALVTVHYVTSEFVEKVRAVAIRRGYDVVIERTA